MTSCVIFDIDGTLADIRHRLHHIKRYPKNYDAFFDAMIGDKPIEAVIRLNHLIGRRNLIGRRHLIGLHESIVVVSGRPNSHREQTELWLINHDVEYVSLYMRTTGDHRPDHIVKREILNQIRADGYEPWLVIDDRPSVVEMWREQGLMCLQAPGHEDEPAAAAGAGKTLLTVMVGPSGGGKTTLAKVRWPERAIISSDDVREDMLGDRRDQSANARVFKAVHALARERLRHGLPVVIDATNLRRKDRMACAQLAPPGVLAQYVVIDRPMSDKIETRDWRPQWLLEKHAKIFRSQLKDILAGDGLAHVAVEDQRTAL